MPKFANFSQNPTAFIIIPLQSLPINYNEFEQVNNNEPTNLFYLRL